MLDRSSSEGLNQMVRKSASFEVTVRRKIITGQIITEIISRSALLELIFHSTINIVT